MGCRGQQPLVALGFHWTCMITPDLLQVASMPLDQTAWADVSSQLPYVMQFTPAQ